MATVARHEAFLKWKDRINEIYNILLYYENMPMVVDSYTSISNAVNERKKVSVFENDYPVSNYPVWSDHLPLTDKAPVVFEEFVSYRKAMLANNPEYFDYLIYTTNRLRKLLHEMYELMKTIPVEFLFYTSDVFNKNISDDTITASVSFTVHHTRHMKQMYGTAGGNFAGLEKAIEKTIKGKKLENFEDFLKIMDKLFSNKIRMLVNYRINACKPEKSMFEHKTTVKRKEAVQKILTHILLLKKQLSNSAKVNYSTPASKPEDVQGFLTDEIIHAVHRKKFIHLTEDIDLVIDLESIRNESKVFKRFLAKTIKNLKKVLLELSELASTVNLRVVDTGFIPPSGKKQNETKGKYLLHNTSFTVTFTNFNLKYDTDKHTSFFKILDDAVKIIENTSPDNAGNIENTDRKTRKLVVT